MPSIKVYKMDGSEAGTMKLSDKECLREDV